MGLENNMTDIRKPLWGKKEEREYQRYLNTDKKGFSKSSAKSNALKKATGKKLPNIKDRTNRRRSSLNIIRDKRSGY